MVRLIGLYCVTGSLALNVGLLCGSELGWSALSLLWGAVACTVISLPAKKYNKTFNK